MRWRGVAAAIELGCKGDGELGESFGLLISIGDDKDGPFDGLPEKGEIGGLGSGGEAGERDAGGAIAGETVGEFLESGVASERQKKIANRRGSHKRLAGEDLLNDGSGRVAGFEREGHDFSSGGFDLLAAGDEVGPVGSFDEDVGEQFGDEIAGGVLVEEGDGIDGLKGGGEGGAVPFGDDGAIGTFEALDAGVGVEGENEHVAERTGVFEKADMAGMEDVITAVGEDDGFAGQAPCLAGGDEFPAGENGSHE